MNNISLLMITPILGQGGTEIYILNLAEFLKEKDINPIVMSDGGVRENEISNKNLKYIKVKCLHKRSPINIFKAIYHIAHVVIRENIQLIHASSIYTTIVSKIVTVILLKPYIKVLITLHGGPNRNIEKTSAKLLNIFADKVVALSEVAKEKLIKFGLRSEKIKVIYNGIKPLKKTTKETTDKIVVGTCGRLTEQKGHKFLIEAISKIEVPGVQCLIAGDGELRNELQKQVNELGVSERVKLLGFRNDIAGLLNSMDVFVLPSLWEQLPISILEAMSLGKPIIATSVNGVPEELGDCGILINPANVEEIINAVELLVKNKELREELGRKAEQRFYKYFRQEVMGEKTLEVYKEFLDL